jgi:LysR family glycine cleavage system transcriptional activator
MTMPRRLPPLNALRAFEAAARHASFSAAGKELNVTHGAVSHQVRGLEEHLGVLLFHRTGRAVALTAEGRRLLPALTEAFDRIGRAVAELGGEADRPLAIGVEPSFAARWLVLRLARFRQAHPGIEVSLLPSTQLVDFDREDVDLAIRYGRGGWPGLIVERLMDDTYFPVAAPEIASRLAKPADLAGETLLHEESTSYWQAWLELAGVADVVDAGRGPRFTESSLALQAAAAGQGVALGGAALGGLDLADGRLVRPFALESPSEARYWLVRPPRSRRNPKAEAFRTWLLAEARC